MVRYREVTRTHAHPTKFPNRDLVSCAATGRRCRRATDGGFRASHMNVRVPVRERPVRLDATNDAHRRAWAPR
jgi:hypothetical protein